MSYILDIATAVPPTSINNGEVHEFYSKMLANKGHDALQQKLSRIIKNSHITTRYSCLPDFNTSVQELFTEGNKNPDVAQRLRVYQDKVMPLAIDVTDKLLFRTRVAASQITHIISVSCTGLMAPGIEFRIADHYKIRSVEKTALNFLGCYAALKAIKQANYIAKAEPDACVLVVCAELCSLHFNSSTKMEDIIANLLFADGAAALLVCGNNSKHLKNNHAFHIDSSGSATIPDTSELMTWTVTPSAFNMYLSRDIAGTLKNNIKNVFEDYLGARSNDPSYWAIHPGGITIVKAVQEAIGLTDDDVADSLDVLKNFGNMSSPTILFILKNIFSKIKPGSSTQQNKIFACAFGPGLNVEMLSLSPAAISFNWINKATHVTQDEVA